MTDDRNLSTEHQNPGDATNPKDTLDREQTGLTPKAPEPSQGTDTGIGQTGDEHAPRKGDFDPETDGENSSRHVGGGDIDPADLDKAESKSPDYG